MKIEIRKNCKICRKKITIKRFRTYCSPFCRNKFHNAKHRKNHTEWQRARNDARAMIPSKKKVQCLICKGWYVQVGSHVKQRHGVLAREYRENFDLEVKRGIVPNWYRKMKAEQCISNGTVENLKKGKKYWYVKGDKKAGRYHRSSITMERLRTLHKYNENHKLRN